MASHEPDFADRPPWTKPSFIASAVLLALVLVAGVTIAVWPTPAQPITAPAPTAPATNAATPTETAPGTMSTVIPTTAPSDVTWQLLGQVAVPVSKSAGPTKVGKTTSGYAHTPTGALIAAAQLSTRSGYSAGREVWEPTITAQFVASADREALLTGMRALADSGQPGSEPGELSQTAGFRYIAYSPDTAVIGLVDRAPGANGAYYITTLTLLWRDGDWRMVAPPGGNWTSISQKATDLSGVVEWGAR